MADMIYRQDAIDVVKELCLHYTPTKSVKHPHIDFVVEELEQLPSAQPERKTGKWLTVSGRLGNEVECNKCHSVFWYWMGNYKFCPSCGARMED